MSEGRCDCDPMIACDCCSGIAVVKVPAVLHDGSFRGWIPYCAACIPVGHPVHAALAAAERKGRDAERDRLRLLLEDAIRRSTLVAPLAPATAWAVNVVLGDALRAMGEEA